MFGRSINDKVGSLMAPNTDAVLPVPDEPGETTLTDVRYTQFLSEKLGFSVGKLDFRGGDYTAFAHDERTQFMNLAFLGNPVLAPFGPYSALTAAVFYRPSDSLTIAFSVLDTFGTPTRSGFDTAFHAPEGTSFATEWTFTVDPFGLPGHQRFGAIYSNKDFILLDQDPQDQKTRPDDWGFYYNFDQYVYREQEDPSQGVGIFGRFGWTSGEAAPFSAFYSLGIGGKGIIPQRDNDTFGLGYYFLDGSDDLRALTGIGSEQGVELFYNIEVTPWLHVTPDLQVLIDPGGSSDNDVAVVYGLRMQMRF
jgi:porin